MCQVQLAVAVAVTAATSSGLLPKWALATWALIRRTEAGKQAASRQGRRKLVRTLIDRPSVNIGPFSPILGYVLAGDVDVRVISKDGRKRPNIDRVAIVQSFSLNCTYLPALPGSPCPPCPPGLWEIDFLWLEWLQALQCLQCLQCLLHWLLHWLLKGEGLADVLGPEGVSVALRGSGGNKKKKRYPFFWGPKWVLGGCPLGGVGGSISQF